MLSYTCTCLKKRACPKSLTIIISRQTPTLNNGPTTNGSSSLSDESDAAKPTNGTSDPKSSDTEGHSRSSVSER